MKKKILLLVGDDPNYDQRMQKICTSLAHNNYDVLLVGIARTKNVKPLLVQPFRQRRLNVISKTGFFLFTEINVRLFFSLLFTSFDIVCAIDLDTIIPAYFLSILRRKKRVYDAHELFCEMPSIALRPRIHKFWKGVERFFLPHFKNGYTVNNSIAEEYYNMYGLHYKVIMNVAALNNEDFTDVEKDKKLLLYQGAVQKGRGIEYLIYAMQNIEAHMIICGMGNYFEEAKKLTADLRLQSKISFNGYVFPKDLKAITQQACIGLNTVTGEGQSYYLSLSNRTFDYMHANTPQVAMNFPEYAAINKEFEIAVLIDGLTANNVENAINRLLNDEALYNKLQQNCKQAKQKYNWQNEEKKLIAFYDKLIND